ncbi:Uma2 family endonuclease [Thermus sp.]|uniref:Uma2 family endonuclease n=1 Tax=Thermus sp. TaxID=275 RepID=UPI00321F8DAD
MVRHRFRVEENLYTQAHPGPEDGLLLVSLSTEAWEREKRLPLYAQAGLPEVWLLAREGLEVHRKLEGGRFLVAQGETIAPLLLPEAELLFQPPL